MAFKVAWLTNSTMIRNLNPEASTVDLLLKSFPFVTADEITNLKAKLPAYLPKAEDFDDTVDKLSCGIVKKKSAKVVCCSKKNLIPGPK